MAIHYASMWPQNAILGWQVQGVIYGLNGQPTFSFTWEIREGTNNKAKALATFQGITILEDITSQSILLSLRNKSQSSSSHINWTLKRIEPLLKDSTKLVYSTLRDIKKEK